MNRREFVLAGAVAAGAVGVVRAGTAGFAPRAANPFYRVIFDTRFAASRTLAAALPHSPAGAVGVAGDVTRLWFDDLSHRWEAGGIVVAGMTTSSTLFCLEQLAQDHWRRVVMRIEHRRLGGTGMHHRITASAVEADAAVGRFGASTPWPEAVAAALAGCRADARAEQVTRTLCARPTAAGAPFPSELVSWVIA